MKEIIKKFKDPQTSLINILQLVQKKQGYISEESIKEIAELSNIPPTSILGVVTFYSQFKLKPTGKHVIKICEGTACHVNESSKIKTSIIEHLGVQEGEITKDGFYSFECVSCLGCCSLAPVIMIDEEAFGKLSPLSVKKVLEDYKKNTKE